MKMQKKSMNFEVEMQKKWERLSIRREKRALGQQMRKEFPETKVQRKILRI